MTGHKPESKPAAFFRLLRLNRTAMVALITGASAFAAGAGVGRSLWMALLPWGLILAILGGLARHLFEMPLARALTLGLLQALYVVMGGAAGRLSPGLGLLAGMFFL